MTSTIEASPILLMLEPITEVLSSFFFTFPLIKSKDCGTSTSEETFSRASLYRNDFSFAGEVF
jgi:hypothetical protein